MAGILKMLRLSMGDLRQQRIAADILSIPGESSKVDDLTFYLPKDAIRLSDDSRFDTQSIISEVLIL
jgi:hypothetical protein